MSRTAGRRPRRRPDPRPRRAARRDDARRPRRPGDQGGEPRQRRRHPRLGAAVRAARRRRPGVDVLPVDEQEQGVDHPRPQGRRGQGGAHRAAAPRRRAAGELPPRHPRPPRLRHRRAGRAQPAAGHAGDQRLRPRRARGRPRRLRPDRAGRGRPDVAHRLRARTTRSGSASRSATCWPACTAPTACWPRCWSGSGPAAARWCAPRCWPRSSACTPSRGRRGRWPARSAARRATTTPRSPRTACSTAPAAACRWRAPTSRCGGGCAPSSASTPRRPGMATNGERVEHRDEVIALLEGAFADIPAEDLLARLDEGRHPGGQGAHDRRGLRLGPGAVAGPARRRRARHARPAVAARPAAAVLRRRVRTARPRRPAATHAAPPVLGADGDAIRAWLAGDGVAQPTATTSRTGTPHERPRPARARRPGPARPGARPGLLDSPGTPPCSRARSSDGVRRASWPRRRRRPGRTSRSSPARARCAAGAWPSSPASSASSPARSGSPPPSG